MKVEGSQNLFRDPNTNAILNTDIAGIERARALKAERKKRALEFERVKEDVQEMTRCKPLHCDCLEFSSLN